MSLKLANLRVLWGTAGAREKFEDMVSQLIHVENPNSQRIRIVVGDGGLDSFEGELSDPDGVDTFQVKYFPDGIGESQKDQLRSSFATVCGSTRFKAKSWTLCLPIDMSLDETKWFEAWKVKQANSGIEIRNPWGALHIETLLLQEKNRTIRESFFREENTELLRKLKKQGDRNVMVHINPVWNRRRLQAQIQLFNSGKGAIYVTSWWMQWGPDGKKGGQQSGETIRGMLPVRLEEHEAADLLIHVDCEVEQLGGIGVIDGARHLWLASDENLIMFKHDAISHRLPGADEAAEEPFPEGTKVDVKARATRPTGMDHDRLEFIFTNEGDRPVSVHNARLCWTYTPARQKPTFPGKPSIAEAGGKVGLLRQAATNQLGPGEQIVFVLEKEMSGFLVEVARGDVLDEDIILEFVTDEKWAWKATMDEIPSVVRAVADSVVESMRR